MLQIVFVLITLRQVRRRDAAAGNGQKTDVLPLYLMLGTAPFFVVRGVFGVLSSASKSYCTSPSRVSAGCGGS